MQEWKRHGTFQINIIDKKVWFFAFFKSIYLNRRQVSVMMVSAMPNLPNNSGIGDSNWRDESADCIKIKFSIGDPAFVISTGKPEAAPFDLLGHQEFNAPVLTRRQRADRLKQQHVAFFKFFAPEAREMLDDLTGNHDSRQRTIFIGASNSWQRWERQYASDGELQLMAVRKHLPGVLKVRPISDHGNVNKIIGKFGGADQFRHAVNQLQSLLHAA
jgi:hypothetical protein